MRKSATVRPTQVVVILPSGEKHTFEVEADSMLRAAGLVETMITCSYPAAAGVTTRPLPDDTIFKIRPTFSITKRELWDAYRRVEETKAKRRKAKNDTGAAASNRQS